MIVITVLCYFLATLFYGAGYRFSTHSMDGEDALGIVASYQKKSRFSALFFQYVPFILACLACLMHGFLLYQWINLGAVQNISLFNILSLMVWLIIVFVVFNHFTQQPFDYFFLVLFPLAILSILLVVFFPSDYFLKTSSSFKMWVHILTSLVALSLLCLSGLQALFLIAQEKQLKSESPLLNRYFLPPLQTMEQLLFRFIGLGFGLLSVVLISSAYFFWHDFFSVSWVMNKAILGLLSWIVFAVLLIGRVWLGWRGYRVAYGVLLGVLLLMMAYLVYQLMMELLA